MKRHFWVFVGAVASFLLGTFLFPLPDSGRSAPQTRQAQTLDAPQVRFARLP